MSRVTSHGLGNLILVINFFSKTIAFTQFLQKKCEREYQCTYVQFPHCGVVMSDIFPPSKIFRETNLQYNFS